MMTEPEREPAIVRVLVADDHPLFRHGLRTLLETVPGFEVVGEAVQGEQAVERALALRPDVVLMDLQMPGTGGIAATRAIAEAAPEVRVLVLTLFDDDASLFAALRAGARGYVLKETDEAELVRAIRAVANGEAIFGPAVAGRVLAWFAAPRAAPPPAFPELTERERDVLRLIAQGRANPVIARQLGLAPKTVANHVSAIFGKLQVADRAEAMLRARDAGLG